MGSKESEQGNAQTMYEHIQTCNLFNITAREDVLSILLTKEFEELLLDWMLCHLQVFEGTAV